MSTEWIALGSALWLGIVTSVSPCPLATSAALLLALGASTLCLFRRRKS